MRKIVYTCDRCGAEIDGAAGRIIFGMCDENDKSRPADIAELVDLMESMTEREAAETALTEGWDLCAECVAAVLRTLIRKDAPRAIVKGPLPDAPKRRGGRRKKEDSNENNGTV